MMRLLLADWQTLTTCSQDYTPANLTNWGWNLVKSDPEVAGGGVIYNLLMRAMPSCYRGNSVYAMFPFVCPSKTRELLGKIHKLDDYDFSDPYMKPPPKPVKSHKAVTDILRNSRSFKVPCEYYKLHPIPNCQKTIAPAQSLLVLLYATLADNRC